MFGLFIFYNKIQGKEVYQSGIVTKMKYMKGFTVLLSLFISYAAAAQHKLDFSAILLNLDGKGNYVRNDLKSEMELPQSYVSGDKLVMQQGEALIMLLNGEEMEVSEGAEVQIPKNVKAESKEIKNMAKGANLNHGLLAQAGAAYSLRGKNNTVPVKSKILDPNKAFLKFQYDKEQDFSLSLKIIDSQTQKILFQQDSITDTLIYLTDIPFTRGKSYYWTISGTPDNKPGMGILAYSTELEEKQLRTFDSFKTNLDYITAIGYYHENGYFYKAYELIQKATVLYPELDIYRILMNNLMGE
jgi:hypothetical protein